MGQMSRIYFYAFPKEPFTVANKKISHKLDKLLKLSSKNEPKINDLNA
jgi:hypothetical protein